MKTIEEQEKYDPQVELQKKLTRYIEWAYRSIKDDNEDIDETFNLLRTNLLAVYEKALQERNRIAEERGIAKGREEERKECELEREYYLEFEVVDGLNQHKDGLNFEEWKQALTTPLKDPN